MKQLPKTNPELTAIFRNAAPPVLSELSGEYRVDMLTVFPSLKRFSHRKIFYKKDDVVLGYNLLFGKTWGRFYVEEEIPGKGDNRKVAVINYNVTENLYPFRMIRDHVRYAESHGLYVGRFYYQVLGRLFFLGYFSLEKVK